MNRMNQMKEKIVQEYWVKKLSGELPKVSLPLITDRKEREPGVRDMKQAQHHLQEIPTTVSTKLIKAAKDFDIALFILVLSGLNIILGRYTGIDEPVVGTVPPSANGNDHRVIFCKTQVSGGMTAKEFITRTKLDVLKAINYSEYHLDDLVEMLKVRNNTDSIDIFNVAFLYEPFQKKNQYLDKFELVLILSAYNGQLRLQVKYPSLSGSPEMVRRFTQNLVTALERILDNPTQEIFMLDILSPGEKDQLLYHFNRTEAEYPIDQTIHRLFAEQVDKTPDNAAVVYEEKELTYRELNKKANQLAAFLRGRGVSEDSIIALLMDRSIEMMAGILGILKAGGAYLPLDPTHPAERNAYMLEHSNARLLLGRKNLTKGLTSDCEVIDLFYDAQYSSETSHLNRSAAPLDLAYVTYTSGSTGKPKGVLIKHNSVVNFIKTITDIIPASENDCILSLTTITFDIFGLETFLPLSRGSKVIIGNQEQQLSTAAAACVIEAQCITILQVTPSRLHLTIADPEAANSLRPLKYLLVGGEAFPGPLLENVRTLTNGKIYNLYGPTETTIWSTLKDVTGREALNIGKPIANTRIYILSASGSLQPVGVLGELYIAGAGLSRGYLNNVSLTAEKFAEFHIDTSPQAGRLYHTGDLARWLPDGNIEFLGRTDYQLKIRGFRVELGEIENQLQAHENIKEAVVIPRESHSGEKYLCGYVVPRSSVPAESLTAAELREFLSQKLPDYMIPSYFVPLEEMPLTPNGKIDRQALPADEGLRMGTGISYVSPETEVEKTIAQLWQEVLRREDKVGMEDNFFDLGGNSLKLIELNRKVNEALNTHIPVMTMFRYPTIRALMQNLNQETSSDTFTDREIDESLSLMDENLKRLETVI